MSKIETAWAEFFESSKIEDINELRKQGWKTAEDIANELGELLNAVRQRLDRPGALDFRFAKVRVNGATRNLRVFRPKKGLPKQSN